MTDPERPRFITPIYEAGNQESAIMYHGAITLSTNQGEVRTEKGTLELLFSPRIRLVARLETDERNFLDLLFLDPNSSVSLPSDANLSHRTSQQIVSDAERIHDLHVNQVVAGDIISAKRFIIHVIGPLMNEKTLPAVATEGGPQGRLEFNLTDWKVCIVAAAGLHSNDEFSFIMEVVPPQAVTVDQLNLFRKRLNAICNFAAGRDIGLGPIVGINEASEICWTKWFAPIYQPWASAFRWCTADMVASILPELAAGIDSLSKTPELEHIFTRSVNLYVSANATSAVLDVKIPIACSGVELLAWATLQANGWITSDTIKKLSAAAYARLFLKWVGVPHQLPDHFNSLRARRGKIGRPVDDGPELLFGVRNDLVHPPKKLTDPEWPTGDELFEAWKLATWYLELGLLRMLGYDGRYSTRVNDSEWLEYVAVPWRK